MSDPEQRMEERALPFATGLAIDALTVGARPSLPSIAWLAFRAGYMAALVDSQATGDTPC